MLPALLLLLLLLLLLRLRALPALLPLPHTGGGKTRPSRRRRRAARGPSLLLALPLVVVVLVLPLPRMRLLLLLLLGRRSARPWRRAGASWWAAAEAPAAAAARPPHALALRAPLLLLLLPGCRAQHRGRHLLDQHHRGRRRLLDHGPARALPAATRRHRRRFSAWAPLLSRRSRAPLKRGCVTTTLGATGAASSYPPRPHRGGRGAGGGLVRSHPFAHERSSLLKGSPAAAHSIIEGYGKGGGDGERGARWRMRGFPRLTELVSVRL
jgi:hypothetical protein